MKRVIITGAAGGIGSAAMEALREKGAEVIGLDLDGDPAKDILPCDVRDQNSVDRAVAEAIEKLGGLDVLINNAGVGLIQSAAARPDDSAAAVLDINLVGPWRVTGAAMDALRASHGRVVNVASGLAHLSVPLAPAYCMSKRGLVGYSDTLRYELGDEIEVATVYPGYIRTPIHEAAAGHGVSLEGMVPAEDVADAAKALVRASLGKNRRDYATTRSGGVGYFFMRHLNRRLTDKLVAARARKAVKDSTLGENADRSAEIPAQTA